MWLFLKSSRNEVIRGEGKEKFYFYPNEPDSDPSREYWTFRKVRYTKYGVYKVVRFREARYRIYGVYYQVGRFRKRLHFLLK